MDWIELLILESMGICMLALGLLSAIRRSFLISSGGVAAGIVVDHIKENAEEGEREGYYRPVIEYRDRDGKVFHMKGRMAEFDREHGIKATKTLKLHLPTHNEVKIITLKKTIVEVVYERRNPRNARVNSFHDLWLLPIFMSSTGVGFMVFGLVMFWLLV